MIHPNPYHELDLTDLSLARIHLSDEFYIFIV